MWLTRQGSRSSGARLRRGQVSGTGEQLRIQGESEYHSPELLFPYGYSAAAAEGGRALMLDGVCAGMAAPPMETSPRERCVSILRAGRRFC